MRLPSSFDLTAAFVILSFSRLVGQATVRLFCFFFPSFSPNNWLDKNKKKTYSQIVQQRERKKKRNEPVRREKRVEKAKEDEAKRSRIKARQGRARDGQESGSTSFIFSLLLLRLQPKLIATYLLYAAAHCTVHSVLLTLRLKSLFKSSSKEEKEE